MSYEEGEWAIANCGLTYQAEGMNEGKYGDDIDEERLMFRHTERTYQKSRVVASRIKHLTWHHALPSSTMQSASKLPQNTSPTVKIYNAVYSSVQVFLSFYFSFFSFSLPLSSRYLSAWSAASPSCADATTPMSTRHRSSKSRALTRAGAQKSWRRKFCPESMR